MDKFNTVPLKAGQFVPTCMYMYHTIQARHDKACDLQYFAAFVGMDGERLVNISCTEFTNVFIQST